MERRKRRAKRSWWDQRSVGPLAMLGGWSCGQQRREEVQDPSRCPSSWRLRQSVLYVMQQHERTTFRGLFRSSNQPEPPNTAHRSRSSDHDTRAPAATPRAHRSQKRRAFARRVDSRGRRSRGGLMATRTGMLRNSGGRLGSERDWLKRATWANGKRRRSALDRGNPRARPDRECPRHLHFDLLLDPSFHGQQLY